MTMRGDAYAIPERLDFFYMLAEHTTHGILVTNRKREIIYVNKAFTTSTGYTWDEALGHNPRILQSGIHEPAFYAELWRSIRERGYWQGEIWNKRKNGEVFVEWQNIMQLCDARGRIAYYGAIFSDITERKRVEERIISQNHELEKLATSDSLTELANRYLFNIRLDAEWQAAKLSRSPLAMILLDVDNFKLYNDTYGHQEGDLCLKRVSSVLRAAYSGANRNLAARYGGEEFAIILPGLHSEQALLAAEQLRLAVLEEQIPHCASPTIPHVTISLGVASCVPDDSSQPTQLIQMADQALYRAKSAGRNHAGL
jgi:diguanylate cyclase (GGDEF)-like protein/PAS domain S-box-containing protein